MKANVIERFGGPDALQLQDIPPRKPDGGDVRICVRPPGVFGATAMPAADVPLPEIARASAEGHMPSLRAHTFGFDEIRRAHGLTESNCVQG
ncbi:hypothetical protein [Burkholderia sp. AW49-1]